MIEKSETNFKQGSLFPFLGRKSRNANKFKARTFFFLEIIRLLQWKLVFVNLSGSLSYLGLKSEHGIKKIKTMT